MRFQILLPVALLSLALFACKNDTKQEPETIVVETTPEKDMHTSAAMEAEFNDPKVGDVYKEYIALKTTLVNTNSADAAAAAENLMTAFANLGVDEKALQAVQTVIESSEDVEAQRTAFELVTIHVEGLLEGALKSGTIYKQFCPMAFNNKGAYWLSNSKEIANPYFGDVMLKCGRIDAEIK